MIAFYVILALVVLYANDYRRWKAAELAEDKARKLYYERTGHKKRKHKYSS